MSGKQIRWGIIGCGDVTEIKSGPAFNKVADSKLVAVMRRNAEKAEDYARRHGVPKWYSSADELINDPEVNAVYVATPPLQHEAFTIASLNAGKPVYVEKPMALNKEAAERMVAAARATGQKLSVAHYRREQPFFKKIKELIHTKKIGEPRLINVRLFQPHRSNITRQTAENWRIDPALSGGGLFHDLAPHQLDLMIYFFGSAIDAKGVSFNSGGYYGADDTTSGTILFKDNVLFTGTWSFNVPQAEACDICEIIGSKGKISFSIFDQKLLRISIDDTEEQILFDPIQHVQQPMINSVVQYFLGNGTNPCMGEEGVEVMTLMETLTKK